MNFSATTAYVELTGNGTTIESMNNGTNITESERNRALGLQITQKLALIAVLAIMFGLGCSASLKRILHFIKKPKHFLTGAGLQLIVLPLLGFAITRIMNLDMPKTIGMIVQASSPGGTYSNIVTYWLDGDKDLSIVMTTVSTLLALGFMPLWLFTFSAILQLDETLRVPFGWLGIGLASMVIPVVLGLTVQRFFPSRSQLLTKIFTILGSLCVVGVMLVTMVLGIYVDVASAHAMLACALLVVCAFATGYAATRIPYLKFTQPERRTVAIEIMFQSTPVAFNVILLSYQNSSALVVSNIVSQPFFYASLQLGSSVIAITSYLIMKKLGFTYFVPEQESEKVEENGERNAAASALMGDVKETNA